MKRVLTVAALVLAGGTLSACGGGAGSDAPTDASVDDFCEGYIGILDYFDEEGETFRAADFSESLAEVGTPEDISDDAREGFEIYVDKFEELGNEATQDDSEVEVSDDEEDKTDAFDDYIESTCADAVSESVG